MGRPPGRIQDTQFQMRVSPEFLRHVDKWRAVQEGKPSRAEAIRRLVHLGLTAKMNNRTASEGQKFRAREMAGKTIDRMADPTAHPDDQASRKHRLLKGPEEFREARVDRPKANEGLPDATPIEHLQLATRMRNALNDAGLKTVGEVRETSDDTLLSLPDLGKISIAHLRKKLRHRRLGELGPKVKR